MNPAHQYLKRQENLEEDRKNIPEHIQALPITNYDYGFEDFSVEHRSFIEKYEWLGHVGNNPRWVYTARAQGYLAALIMFNEPYSYSYPKELECLIQRGASASWTPKNLGSKLVMSAIKGMVANTPKRIFIGYADSDAGERGVIYKSCGFKEIQGRHGAKERFRHPWFKGPFTNQTLNRTSTLKKWYKEAYGLSLPVRYLKPNGFKDLTCIPTSVKIKWKEWQTQIRMESTKEILPNKGKFIMILGSNNRETIELRKRYSINSND